MPELYEVPRIKSNQGRLDISTSVRYLKGVGPKMAAHLAKLGLMTVEDLLRHYPREWEDRRQTLSLKEIQPDREMTLRGEILSSSFVETSRGFAIATASIQDPTGQLQCKWMRRKSFQYDVLQTLKKDIQPGKTILVHGKIARDFVPTMIVEEYEVLNGTQADSIHVNRIVPLYPVTEGISVKFLRNLIHTALSSASIPELLPETVQSAHSLMRLDQALQEYHFPTRFQEKAKEALAFQELFCFQTVLALVRKKKESPKDYRNQIHKKFLTPFKEKCGFEFTLSQKKVIREIFEDMTSKFPMNRLLQGDVGSGKTIVALCAMLLACENDLQSVLMAPTEILAEQHYITMKHFLKPFPLRLGLLTGSASGSERKKFLEGCANGEIHMAIGTHALLDKKVQFKRCGLVVIDEQHRFGVKHRLMLAARKPVPDTLVMTATPIPRTLALGLYGDLDISVIEDLPPGRQKIETWCKNESESYQIVKSEVDRGRQAYIVYPLVDESDKVELKSAIREFEKLVQTSLKGYSVGLLHGQMSGKEKEKVMTGFYAGNFSILVATTVIEVGIDVPNATVMVIQNAERFGLATLHQLRGRVGRGKDPSYCVLVIHQEKERSNQRIQTFLQTQNGFQLAESDLKLRGPGEIFGTSQHGVPPFKVANFLDGALVSRCQKAARDLVQSDPRLEKPENRALRDHLRKHFSKTWYWANIA